MTLVAQPRWMSAPPVAKAPRWMSAPAVAPTEEADPFPDERGSPASLSPSVGAPHTPIPPPEADPYSDNLGYGQSPPAPALPMTVRVPQGMEGFKIPGAVNVPAVPTLDTLLDQPGQQARIGEIENRTEANDPLSALLGRVERGTGTIVSQGAPALERAATHWTDLLTGRRDLMGVLTDPSQGETGENLGVLGKVPGLRPQDIQAAHDTAANTEMSAAGHFITGLAAMGPGLADPQAVAAMVVTHAPTTAVMGSPFTQAALAATARVGGLPLARAVEAELHSIVGVGNFGAAQAALMGQNPVQGGIEGAKAGALLGVPFAGFAGARGVGAVRAKAAPLYDAFRQEAGRASDALLDTAAQNLPKSNLPWEVKYDLQGIIDQERGFRAGRSGVKVRPGEGQPPPQPPVEDLSGTAPTSPQDAALLKQIRQASGGTTQTVPPSEPAPPPAGPPQGPTMPPEVPSAPRPGGMVQVPPMAPVQPTAAGKAPGGTPPEPVGTTGTEQSPTIKLGGQAPGEDAMAEMGVLDAYLAQHDPSKGQVPARGPYLPSRDEAFAAEVNGGAPRGGDSAIRQGIESVQEAIATGERLGYRPEDIAAYLKRNYTPGGREAVPLAGALPAEKPTPTPAQQVDRVPPVDHGVGEAPGPAGGVEVRPRPAPEVGAVVDRDRGQGAIGEAVHAPESTDQAAQLADLDRRVAEAKAFRDRQLKISGDRELFQKRAKGDAMRFAAERRKITGQLTSKEAAAEKEREAGNYVGKPVTATIDGKPVDGKVLGTAYGLVRVETAAGVRRVKPEDVKPRAEGGATTSMQPIWPPAAQPHAVPSGPKVGQTSTRGEKHAPITQEDIDLGQQIIAASRGEKAPVPPSIGHLPEVVREARGEAKTPGPEIAGQLRRIAGQLAGSKRELLNEWASTFERKPQEEQQKLRRDLATVTTQRHMETFGPHAGHQILAAMGMRLDPQTETAVPALPLEAQALKDQGNLVVGTVGREPSAGPQASLARAVADLLRGSKPITPRALFDAAKARYGGSLAEGKFSAKDAYDAAELGMNLYIKGHPVEFDPRFALPEAQHAAALLEDKTSLLPTQTRRDSEMESMQQFSTPPAYAYAAAWVASLRPGEVVLEPSAGTGSIAVHAMNAGAKVIGNELAKDRADLLRVLGPEKVYTENAEQISKIIPERPTTVVMNPPFSQTAGRMGDKMLVGTGAKHIEEALSMLVPGGRLVAIVGRGMGPDAKGFMPWWQKISKAYTVRANVGVAGKVYSKYGTSFATRLLVIDKAGPTEGGFRAPSIVTGYVESIPDLLTKLEGVRDGRAAATEQPSAAPGRQSAAGESGRAARPGQALRAPTDVVGAPERQGGPGRPELPTEVGGQPGRDAAALEADGGARLPVREGRERDAGEPAGAGAVGEPGGGGEQTAGRPERVAEGADAGVRPGGLTLEKTAAPAHEAGDLKAAVYEPYKPQKVRIAGAVPHPTALVESAAMAAVQPPEPTYRPSLPANTVKDGRLSDAQLEAVTYAGQAHEQTLPDGRRKGFFVGDGTGVGKGRTTSGIILDNIAKGRKKHLWISERPDLINDAKRDMEGAGGDPGIIVPLNKVKVGEKIGAKDGVLFLSYSTMRSVGRGTEGKEGPKRLKQILDWLGPDFDGVIAFDEAHAMANAVPMKEQGKRGAAQVSQTAQAGLELTNALPKARVVYISATGATEVRNLAYTDRLGLWGEGTAFPNKLDFIQKVASGGIAAMELVARDMKAMGLYLARNQSFEGVEQRKVEHVLTPEQESVYNELADAWRLVYKNVNAALAHTASNEEGKVDGRAKGQAMSHFYGTQQRFWNQVLTAMQMPTVIQAVEKDLAAGHAAVLQIVNTDAAAQTRALREMQEGDTLEDLDLTPRQQLMEYVKSGFPVYQQESYIDPLTEKTSMRPVKDSQGNLVKNPEAVALREALLDKLGGIRVPDGPLDTLIDHFGAEKVAEVTGRKERRERTREDDGSEKTRMVKRPGTANQVEARAFADDKKRVLVFSQAGGTGSSYHADRTFKNQRKRMHYLVQPGWRADKAIQGLGRTKRTNEAQPPEYALCSTNIPGHKRFVSSIARRVGQLGALTKGERKTGGQGLFVARDNLENEYARAALHQLYRDIAGGRVKGMPLDKFEEDTGLKLTDEHGGLLKDLPPIERFLNRVLAFRVDAQNRIFDEFAERMDANIRRAQEEGTLDVGVETFRADGITKKSEDVIHTDEASGAQTKLVKLEVRNKTETMPFKAAAAAAGQAGYFVRNTKSGRVYAVSGLVGTRTDASTGRTTQGRTTYSVRGKRQFESMDKLSTENMQTIGTPSTPEAQAAWDAELAQVPPFTTEDTHIITGAILPVWDRLNGPTRVWRLKTDEGEKMLGRVVPDEQVAATLARFGINRKGWVPESPEDAAEAVLTRGFTLNLSNGWQIRPVTVAHEARIELTGPDYQHDTELARAGVFKERHQYRTRYYIPAQGEAGIGRAAEVIGAVTRHRDIIEAVPPPKGGGKQSGPSSLAALEGLSEPSIRRIARNLHIRDRGPIEEVRKALAAKPQSDLRAEAEQIRNEGESEPRGGEGMRPGFILNPLDLLDPGKRIEMGVKLIGAVGTARRLTLPRLAHFSAQAVNKATEAASVEEVARAQADYIAAIIQRETGADTARWHRAGAVSTENLLRGVRKRELDAAAAATDPKEATRHQDAAAAVNTLVGPGRYFPDDTAYEEAKADPKVRALFDAVERHYTPVNDPYFKRAMDMDPTAALEPKGEDDTIPHVSNLAGSHTTPTGKLAFAGPPGAGGMPSQIGRRMLLRKSQKGRQATGTAAAYNIDLRDKMADALTKNARPATLKRFYDQLVADGLATITAPDRAPDTIKGMPATSFGVRAGLLVKPGEHEETTRINLARVLTVPKVLAAEVEKVAGATPKATFGELPDAVVKPIVAVNLIAGLREAVTHNTNLLGRMLSSPGIGPTYRGTSLAAKIPEHVERAVGHAGILRVPVAVHALIDKYSRWSRGGPEVLKDIVDLAKLGVLRDIPGDWTAKPWRWPKAMIERMDLMTRLCHYDAWRFLRDIGLEKDTPESLRRFILVAGRYNRRLNSQFVNSIRESGIGNFVVAGTTFNAESLKAAAGAAPGIPKGVPQRVALGLMTVAPWLGTLAMVAIVNRLTSGSVWGREGVPAGAIDLGTNDEQGRPRFVDPLAWFGVRRALRAAGFSGAIAGTSGKSEWSAREMVNQWIMSPLLGPAVRVGMTALTGHEPYLEHGMAPRRVAHPVAPGPHYDERQAVENLKTAGISAVGQIRPALEEKDQPRSARERLAETAKSTFREFMPQSGSARSGAETVKIANAAQLKTFVEDIAQRARRVPVAGGKRLAFIERELRGLSPTDDARARRELFRFRKVMRLQPGVDPAAQQPQPSPH